jgi:hypothetical protein
MDRFLDPDCVELYCRLRETSDANERQQILELLAQKRAKFKLEMQAVLLAKHSRIRIECRPE